MRELRDQYLTVRTAFGELATFIAGELEGDLRRQGLRCTITTRTKDVASVLRKQLLRGYEDPINEMTDLAGVRIVIPFSDWVSTIQQSVAGRCEILKVDEKVQTLEPNQLGYLGVHYDV